MWLASEVLKEAGEFTQTEARLDTKQDYYKGNVVWELCHTILLMFPSSALPISKVLDALPQRRAVQAQCSWKEKSQLNNY